MLPLALMLLCAVTMAVAEPIVSPPAEQLAPLTYDFPRPGPPISAQDTWEGLTQGTNLALGAPYRFDRKPNYGSTLDAGDATQLTDGKIIAGDHIWYYKDAVGYAGAEPSPTVCLDLGQSYPIKSVVAHVQGGGAHEGSLRYPVRFDIYVSDDDRTYHLVDSVMKREFLDQRGAFYDLPEAAGNFPPGNPKTQAFHFGNLQTRGRYVAVRMALAGAYNALDEIAVMRGDHDPAAVKFDPKYDTSLTFDGVELLYPRDWMLLPQNVSGGFCFAVRDSRRDTKGPVTYRMDLPAAISFSWSGPEALQQRPHERDGEPFIEYSVVLPGTRTSLQYFYVGPLAARPPRSDVRMHFHAETADHVQPERSVRLIPTAIPAAPPVAHLFFALGWTGLDMQTQWPGAPQVLRDLGFTHASVGSWEMPAIYDKAETAVGQKWLDEQARPAGLQVCLTDSPFHIMEAQWGEQPDFAAAYGQTDPPQKLLCPSYRGKYYRMEVARIVQRFRYRKPEIMCFDIECFGHAKKHVQQCALCRQRNQQNQEPVAFATDMLAEMLREIKTALDQAADEIGRPHPRVGLYHASPAYIYHDVFDFAKLYPQAVQFDNPEVYCRCWPPAVAEIIRTDKARLPADCPIIAWVSPGTLNWEGETPPGRYFDALMELFCNGGIGAAYYTPWNLSPGDLLAQSQAVRIMAPVADILAQSALCDTKGWVSGDLGSVSAVQSGEERIVLVSDYRHLGDSEVVVKLPVTKPAEVVDLVTGRRTAEVTPERSELRVRVSGAYRSRPFYVGHDWGRRSAGAVK